MSMLTPIPILIYHSLSAKATQPYKPFSMDPGQFEEQMQHIATGGYTSLTVSELVAALAGPPSAMPQRPIVITIDDGFEDAHSVALPILTRLGLKSTLYVVTGAVGGTSRWLTSLGEGERPMLSAGQIRDLDAAGVELGPHGHRHVALDELPFGAAVAEIETSGRALEDIVGHKVSTFAYPFGYHTGRIKRHLRLSGFDSACAVKQALSHVDDDHFALARAIVGAEMPLEGLDQWLRGEGLPMSWRGERPQTRVWRIVRRAKRVVSGPTASGTHD